MRFVADVMLGRLARFLRFHGYDVEYDNHASDDDLLAKSSRRILLTKDRALAARTRRAYLVRTVGAENQLAEIVQEFPQKFCVSAHAVRCLFCNTKIVRIAKRKVEHLVPPFIYVRYPVFYFCPHCRRIYWPGSHYERMSRMIK